MDHKAYFPQHGVQHQSHVCPQAFLRDITGTGQRRRGLDDLLEEGPRNPQDKGKIDTPEVISTAPNDQMQRDVDAMTLWNQRMPLTLNPEEDNVIGDQAAACDHRPAVSSEEVPTRPLFA